MAKTKYMLYCRYEFLKMSQQRQLKYIKDFVKGDLLQDELHEETRINKLAQEIYDEMKELYETKKGKADIDLIMLDTSKMTDDERESKIDELNAIMNDNDDEIDNSVYDIILSKSSLPAYAGATDSSYEGIQKMIKDSHVEEDLAKAFMKDHLEMAK